VRRKIAVLALGAGLAASFAPLSPASAVCSYVLEVATGSCNPCYYPNVVLSRYGQHVDCVR
jgi:hypothetical protein